jgi:hypothetical protein
LSLVDFKVDLFVISIIFPHLSWDNSRFFDQFIKQNKIIMKHKILMLIALIFIGALNEVKSQSLSSSKEIYLHDFFVNETIVINFSDGPGNAKDWIGIYKEDQLPGIGDYLIWSYVDGTQSGNTGKKFGTVEFDDFFVPGTYKAYLLEDNGYTILASSSFKITDEVILENTPPSVEGQSVNVDEDGSVSITLKGEDDDGDDLEFTVVSQPKNGTLSGSAPNLTYSPKANFNGDDSFTFKANDGVTDSNNATVSIKIIKKDVEPSLTMSQPQYEHNNIFDRELIVINFSDGPGNANDWIGIYKEDQLPGIGDYLTWSYVDGTQSGNTGKKSGAVEFDDFFVPGTYKAYLLENNGFTILASSSFIITAEEIPENTPPSVEGQSVNVDEDGSVSITLKGEDDDGDDLEFTVVSQPKNGTLSGSAPNLTYSPKANFNGDDSFTFKVFDGLADSNTATVAISVKSVNDLPVVFSQSANVDEDGSVLITLKAQDNDGDNLEFTVVSQPKNGTLSGSAPNLTYSPKANFNGDDSFTFKVFDGVADSNTVTVVISVKTVNDIPAVFSQSANVDEDGSVSITLKAEDNDGDNLEFTVVSQPKNGTLSGSAPNLTYSPKANFNGDDSFTFKVFDGLADSNTATVAISVKTVNDLPVVFSQSVNVDEDGSVSITLKAQDNDGDNLKFTVVSQPKNGTLSGSAPNLTYSPKANFNGDDSFTFKVFDGLANSNTATVAISVKGVAKPKVMLSKTEYLENEIIRIDFSGGPANKKDWIGIYDGDQFPGNGEALIWSYVDGTEVGNTGKKSGTIEYDKVLQPGTYKVYFLENNDYNILATTSFVVTGEVVDSTDKVIKLESGIIKNDIVMEYLRSEDIVISYSGGSGNSGDFIGIRNVNDNGIFNIWKTADKESGTVKFLNKYLPAGNYFVYFIIDGYIKAKAGLSIVNYDVQASDPSWTIFVYGNGDSNLSNGWLNDRAEMQKVGSSDKFKIIIQTDLDSKRSPGGDRSDYPVEYRDKVTRELILANGFKTLEVLPELNMDDPKNLEDFLSWGLKNHKADRYGLVLWNHGSQFHGYGGDHNNYGKGKGYDYSTMLSADVRNSLMQAMGGNNITKFDFISFDTCLMGGAELLVDYHDLCDVYIACTEVDFGAGWDYTILGYLKDHPTVSNIEFAKREVEVWGLHHNRRKCDIYYKGHVAYDFSKFDIYNEKFKAFAEELLRQNMLENAVIPKLRRQAIHYRNVNDRGDGTKGPSDYIDLGTFAKEIANNSNGKLRSVSLELLDSINQLIIAKSNGSRRQDAIGLSIYYPLDGDPHFFYARDTNYTGNWATQSAWNHVRQNFLQPNYGGDLWLKNIEQTQVIYSKDSSPPVLSSGPEGSKSGRVDVKLNDIEEYFVATYEKPAVMPFEVEDGDDAYAAYVSLVSNELTGNPNEYVYLGEIGSALLDGEGEYEVEWDGTMPIISLADSDTYDPIYLGGWAMEAGSDLYMSYADYQAPNSEELIPLILVTKFDEDGFGAIDTILDDAISTNDEDGNELGSLSPVLSNVEFESGGKLFPVYYMEELTEDGEYESWFVSSEDVFITIPENGKEGLEISFQTIEEGNYAVEVQTFDYFDNASEVLTYFVYVPEEGDGEPMLELSIGIENGNIVVSWPLEFKGYSLEWTDDLGGANLFNVPANEINISDEKYSFTHQPVDQARFYRLIKR